MDRKITSRASDEKIECYATIPERAEACVRTVDLNNQSMYFTIQALELVLIAGTVASSFKFARELHKL